MAKEKPMKAMNIRLPYDTWLFLKITATKANQKMNPFIVELIESMRKKNQKKD